jgi:hypothetical protein
MSFGKRGVVPYSNIKLSGTLWKEYFTRLSRKRPNFFTLPGILTAAGEARRQFRGDLAYPVACLTIGIMLGGGLGATLAPQLLHAENAGVYDFIHMNDAAMRAWRPAPMAAPRAALPQITFGQRHGRGGVMQARLQPGEQIDRHRLARRARVLTDRREVPEIGTKSPDCANCEIARFGSPLEAILHDKTLRAGDIVMMGFGAMVFLGGEHLPYTRTDFSDFRKSNLLTQKERKLIDDDLGLSRRAELMRNFMSKARDSKPTEVARAAGSHLSVTP